MVNIYVPNVPCCLQGPRVIRTAQLSKVKRTPTSGTIRGKNSPLNLLNKSKQNSNSVDGINGFFFFQTSSG